MTTLPLETSTSIDTEIFSLFWILLAAFVSPVLSRLTRGYVPDVVLLLVFGVLLGPDVAGLASTEGGVSLVSELGLGMLFLLAGFELDPLVLKSRQGASAVRTWIACVIIGYAIASFIVPGDVFTAEVAVAIAITSTALGTLLPIMKSTGMLGTPMGQAILVHGAVGELLPIIAMALLLSSHNIGSAAIVLVLFVILAAVVGRVPQHLLSKIPWLGGMLAAGSGGTSQMIVRAVVLLLISLMALAAAFELDVVLGAFAAGAILRRIGPDADPHLEEKLDTLAYGLLVPIFFVSSGLNIDLEAVSSAPWTLLAVLLLIVGARGLPISLVERFTSTGSGLTTNRERVQLSLYGATGLPIIVAVTSVAVSTDLMPSGVASILVASGAASVLIFPLAARLLGRKDAQDESSETTTARP
ncbi:cation:proton antiporter [Ornithinimicrobium sp. Arc0846-15]|nr:cation:proton antiporter [Ornithinimicrobium laminariae]